MCVEKSNVGNRLKRVLAKFHADRSHPRGVNGRSKKRKNERTNERTYERTNERTNERTIGVGGMAEPFKLSRAEAANVGNA